MQYRKFCIAAMRHRNFHDRKLKQKETSESELREFLKDPFDSNISLSYRCSDYCYNY